MGSHRQDVAMHECEHRQQADAAHGPRTQSVVHVRHKFREQEAP